jgi:hypothetical protein
MGSINQRVKQRVVLLLSLLPLLFLLGCKAKKQVTDIRYEVQKDTILVEKIKKVYEQVNDTIVIDQPCDSLGNLKDFQREVKTPQGSITIGTVGNTLQATINLDSIVQSIEKEYQSKTYTKTTYLEKEIVRNKIPVWMFITLGISLLCNLALFKAIR